MTAPRAAYSPEYKTWRLETWTSNDPIRFHGGMNLYGYVLNDPIKVPESFVNDTLWPEYQQIASTLRSYIDQITDRIVAEVIHADSSDAEEKREPSKLAAAATKDGK
jgi:hypothetical protein